MKPKELPDIEIAPFISSSSSEKPSSEKKSNQTKSFSRKNIRISNLEFSQEIVEEKSKEYEEPVILPSKE